jgi:hypothetical protein
MPASTDIYGSIQQVRPTNKLAELAQVMQVQGFQQQGELGRMKMDEMRRDREQENALSAAYASALGADGKLDRNKLYSAAAGAGLGAKLPGIQKGFAEADKVGAEAQGKLLENTKKRVDLAGQAFGFVRQNPTLENANSAIDFLGQNGVWDAGQVQQYKAAVAADPTKIGTLAEQAFRAALDAKEQLSKYETRNLGGTTDTLAIDPVTGQTRTVNTVQNTQSPDNKASVQASMANAAATREVAQSNRDAARISANAKQDRDTEMKLADDYRAESKGFAETSTAMKKVFGAIETADKNPGSALAAGTAFMKLLDPNSVVRESELGMALNASGWFDRAMNVANTLQNGKVMTAEQKKNLRAAAEDLFEEAKAAQREVDAAFGRRAKDYKLEPARIIIDRGQNAPRPAPKPQGTGREVAGKVSNGEPDVFSQADAILRGGK